MELFAFSDYRSHNIHQLSGGTQQKLNFSCGPLLSSGLELNVEAEAW